MAKASLSKLLTNTHKGRPTRTATSSALTGSRAVNNPAGTKQRYAGRYTGRYNEDVRLTTAALTKISPTPTGPEPHWPGGTGS